MVERFGATTVVDRPPEAVFAFLADGENDKKFSARIVEIEKRTDGPPGVGTVYSSTAKDGGMKAKHELVGFALRSARKGADDFAAAIKQAIEAEVS